MKNILIVDSAKVMAKGQITLPKDIRSKLHLSTGDRVTLICEEDRVILMNSAVYAMKMLQKEMENEAEKANIRNDDDVIALVKETRKEIEGFMRILIDTNILISASLYKVGTPYQAYLKAVTYPNHGMVCDQNIDELRRIFNQIFPYKIQALEHFLAVALTTLEVVPTPEIDMCCSTNHSQSIQQTCFLYQFYLLIIKFYTNPKYLSKKFSSFSIIPCFFKSL